MAEKVKVKLLKNTPLGNAGDVVEVPKPLADQMCAVRMLHDGHRETPYRSAKPADEKDPEDVFETASQAMLAGKKNIVETPKEELPTVPAAAQTVGDADTGKGKKLKAGA